MKTRTPNVIGGTLGFLWLLVILVPIYYIVVTSVRPREDYFSSNPLSLPTEFTLEPFRYVLENDFLRYFGNSVFVTVITVYGSILKIFSPVPAVGYWAQHNAFREAQASGAESFGTARTPEAIDAVVRNTFIQGSLSILFVVLAVIVIVTALVRTAQAFTHRDDPDHPSRHDTEDPYRPAGIYAPAGLVASAQEKELEQAWADYHRAHAQPRRRSHG